MRRLPLLVLLALSLLLIPAPARADCRTGRTVCLTYAPAAEPICSSVMLIPVAWTRCTADAECRLVRWDCCGCGGSGLSIGIAAKFGGQYTHRYAKFCPDHVRPPGDPRGLRCPEWDLCLAQGDALFCNAQKRCEFGFR